MPVLESTYQAYNLTLSKIQLDDHPPIDLDIEKEINGVVIDRVEWDVLVFAHSFSTFGPMSSEAEQYLRKVTQAREEYFKHSIDIPEYAIPSIHPGAQVKIVEEEKVVDIDVRADLLPGEPYVNEMYYEEDAAISYVNRVAQRRILDFMSFGKSFQNHGVKTLDVPGDGCGIGYVVFTCMGFNVLSSEPSYVMRNLIKKTKVFEYLHNILAINDMPKFSARLKIIEHMQTLPIEDYSLSTHPYQRELAFFSHVRDYGPLPSVNYKWVSFEHRYFSSLSAFSSPYAPYGTSWGNFPNFLQYPISITNRANIIVKHVNKEVMTKFVNYRFYDNTLYEHQYVKSFDPLSVFNYNGSSPCLHIVRNSPVIAQPGDSIWHTIVGHELSESVVTQVASLLSPQERQSIGMDFPVTMKCVTDNVCFVPYDSNVYEDSQKIVLKKLEYHDRSVRYFYPVLHKMYTIEIGGVSDFYIARKFKIGDYSLTIDQWLMSYVDEPPPVTDYVYFYHGIVYSDRDLSTVRDFIKLEGKDAKRFTKAMVSGDPALIRNVISRVPIV